jgi:ABC-type multidrug transport system ATPase subunit
VNHWFGPVQALSDVDFEVRACEVVGLVGDNGAGKSTLVKIIVGIHSPDEGELFFDGTPVSFGGPKAAVAIGIASGRLGQTSGDARWRRCGRGACRSFGARGTVVGRSRGW